MTKKEYKQTLELLTDKTIAHVRKNVCGEFLGSGCYRDVYVLKSNPKYVIKIERDMSTGNFANVMEWRNYINNQYFTFLAEWLAPCELINQTGNILVQQRITHGRRKDYPKYVPVMFTDLKLKNFGWIGEKFVCCDYSYFPFLSVSIGKKKFKWAKWWGTLK